jgi:hypothetical protein
MSGCPYAVPIYHRRRSPVPHCNLAASHNPCVQRNRGPKESGDPVRGRDQSELTRSDVVLLGGLHAALGISRIGLLKNLRC